PATRIAQRRSVARIRGRSEGDTMRNAYTRSTHFMPAYQAGVAEQRERCTSPAHEDVRRLICVPKGRAKCLSAAMVLKSRRRDAATCAVPIGSRFTEASQS